jgi:hypothetical protein
MHVPALADVNVDPVTRQLVAVPLATTKVRLPVPEPPFAVKASGVP